MDAVGPGNRPGTSTEGDVSSSISGTKNSKKRKRGGDYGQEHVDAGSPAPSDSVPEVLTSRTDLFSRPQLKYSRGPVFTPVFEGSAYNKTDLVGVNRVGFRYTPAGIKVAHLPSLKPLILFRSIETLPSTSRISWEDRSTFIHVSKDGLSLLGTKGHRSARMNTPLRSGAWFLEINIIRAGDGERSRNEGMREGCHVRLGFGRREAPLNGPVGLDGYSYGIRDKTGEKVTLSRPKPYAPSKTGFRSGDVVGMYISLPPKREPDWEDEFDPAHMKRERIAIDFKGQEMFEMMEYPQEKEMVRLMEYPPPSRNTGAGAGGGLAQPGGVSQNKPSSKTGAKTPTKNAVNGKVPGSRKTTVDKTKAEKEKEQNLRPLPTLPNSRIAFFVNGVCQGTAFHNIYDYLQLRQSTVKAPLPSSSKSKSNSAKNKDKRRPKGEHTTKESHKDNPFDDGTLGYYPFVSLFNDAEVRINPGPVFEYEPPGDVDRLLERMEKEEEEEEGDASSIAPVKPDEEPSSTNRCWRPLSDRYAEFMAEQWALDDKEEEEALLAFQDVAATGIHASNEAGEGKEGKGAKSKAKNGSTKGASRKTKTQTNALKGEGTSTSRKRAKGQKGQSPAAFEPSPTITPISVQHMAPGHVSHPSPLRHASVSAYEGLDEFSESAASPAPTPAGSHRFDIEDVQESRGIQKLHESRETPSSPAIHPAYLGLGIPVSTPASPDPTTLGYTPTPSSPVPAENPEDDEGMSMRDDDACTTPREIYMTPKDDDGEMEVEIEVERMETETEMDRGMQRGEGHDDQEEEEDSRPELGGEGKDTNHMHEC
ncbi:hypothetical protein C8R42DRAFT_718280 [Lentinula raphanica]|nr:hypothetical protein C8R42DRAFT_718280 [Lentinula raphanica]